MVITLELPVGARNAARLTIDPLLAKESRFGALPHWIEEVDKALVRHLTRLAVARSVPLAGSDYLQ